MARPPTALRDRQNALIRRHYPSGGAEAVLRALAAEGVRPLTAQAVRKRAGVLGLRMTAEARRAARDRANEKQSAARETQFTGRSLDQPPDTARFTALMAAWVPVHA